MTAASMEILLVEDNANDEMLAMHAFQKYDLAKRVHVVRDGAEALEYVFCTGSYADRPFENPFLILLDKKLPFVDGMEVLRQIRADPRTRLIRIVMLTSSAEECDVVESYELGVNSYIVKPVDFEKFNETARHLGQYWLNINRLPPGEVVRRVTDATRPGAMIGGTDDSRTGRGSTAPLTL
jgi:two-component system, response regulator